MTGLGCIRANILLERRAHGLTEADRLRLEEHLQGCGDCRKDEHTLDRLRGLSARAGTSLTVEARERAIGRALREASHPASIAAPSWGPAVWSGGMALASAVALLLWVQLPARAPEQARPQSNTAPSYLLAGEVTGADSQTPDEAQLLAGAEVASAGGARIALAHAEVELAPGTRLRWNAGRSTVELRGGRVVTKVDPARHAEFNVATERFVARVLGTRFAVDEDGVQVFEGHVRVATRDGDVLVESLGPGGIYRYQEPEANGEAEAEAEAEPTLPAHDDEAEAIARRERPTHADSGDLLGRARSTLARGDVSAARALIAEALEMRASRTDRAEGLSLRAECDLVAGDLDGAVEGYLAVARRFGRLSAGQNALFAAARIEANRGHARASRQLLERYLERYPDGPFAEQARSRLDGLGDTKTR